MVDISLSANFVTQIVNPVSSHSSVVQFPFGWTLKQSNVVAVVNTFQQPSVIFWNHLTDSMSLQFGIVTSAQAVTSKYILNKPVTS